jgi:hypothetical protein
MKKSREAKFKEKYRGYYRAVLSSIASVGRAGRTCDPAKIADARNKHRALMTTVRTALGLIPA